MIFFLSLDCAQDPNTVSPSLALLTSYRFPWAAKDRLKLLAGLSEWLYWFELEVTVNLKDWDDAQHIRQEAFDYVCQTFGLQIDNSRFDANDEARHSIVPEF